jgi:hypothetical protein
MADPDRASTLPYMAAQPPSHKMGGRDARPLRYRLAAGHRATDSRPPRRVFRLICLNGRASLPGPDMGLRTTG